MVYHHVCIVYQTRVTGLSTKLTHHYKRTVVKGYYIMYTLCFVDLHSGDDDSILVARDGTILLVYSVLVSVRNMTDAAVVSLSFPSTLPCPG